MAGDFLHLDEKTTSQWPEPSPISPDSRKWFTAYSITLTVLTSAVVLVRLWSQAKRSTNGLGLDDVVVVFGWVFSILLTTAFLIGTQHYDFGRHLWDVPRSLYDQAALIQWLSEGAFMLSTCFTKISVLCFFKRLDSPYSTSLKHIIYAFVVLIACNTFADILVLILQCRPISASWTILDPARSSPHHCISKEKYYVIHGMVTCFSTIFTIMIPVLVLRHFPMTKLQRTGLRIIAIVSLSVLLTGIARTVFLYRFATSANGDATWNAFDVFVFAQMESQLALICASLPFLHRFFQHRPTLPVIVSPNTAAHEPHDSFIPRINFLLRGKTKQMLRHILRRTDTKTSPLPQVQEIPEREFESLQMSAPTPVRPSIETTYERYKQGDYGPPVPPKDLGDWLEVYRQDHGQMVRGYPF